MFFIFLALQGEVKELRGQLEETCRQNRKLQEHYDEEMDRSVALNSSLKKLNSELDQNKAHTAQIAEEYEAKVLLRFIYLFIFWFLYKSFLPNLVPTTNVFCLQILCIRWPSGKSVRLWI